MRKAQDRTTVLITALAILTGLALTGAFAVGASKYLGSFGWPVLPGLLLAAIVGAAALAVPAHWLPAIALAAFIIVPNRITPDGYTLRIPLWGFLIGIWVLRRLLASSRSSGPRADAPSRNMLLGWRVLAYAAAVAFLVWSLMASLRSDQIDTGLAWVGSMVVCVFLPLLVLDARREAALLRSTWLIGGAVIGTYAVVELLLQSSPLYGNLYRIIGVGDVQHWVLHRSEASFGHPLLAGTFFATAATLGIVTWLGSHRARDLICGAIAAAGAVATVSRGSMAAMAIAIALGLVAWVLANPNRSMGKPALFAVLGLVAGVGVLNSTPVVARDDSLESTLSAGARETGFTVAIRGAQQTNWLGSGPGTSGITGRLFDDVVIENSALQLLLSVGIPGLLLFMLFLSGVGLTALAARDIAAAAALLAFGICLVGYNAIDAVRATHLLLGFLVIICMNPMTAALARTKAARAAGDAEPLESVRPSGADV
ncbi:MAG: hypothetical protein ABWZ98_05320 [Nakamurella sp.]